MSSIAYTGGPSYPSPWYLFHCIATAGFCRKKHIKTPHISENHIHRLWIFKRNHFHCVFSCVQNQIVENPYAKFPTFLMIIYVMPTFFIENAFTLTCIQQILPLSCTWCKLLCISEQPVRHNSKTWISIVTLVCYYCTDDDEDDDNNNNNNKTTTLMELCKMCVT